MLNHLMEEAGLRATSIKNLGYLKYTMSILDVEDKDLLRGYYSDIITEFI